jgi:hypothetical protein
MFVSSRFRAFAILVVAAVWSGAPCASNAEPVAAFRVAQIPPVSPAPDPNVLKMQEALVWTGYYEGPIDGSAGPGTQTAAKKFQHELGKPETGTLDDSQNAALAQRAQTTIQATGYRSIADSRAGIRIGIPFTLASQKKNVNAGTDYVSTDGRIQIGLRAFRSGQDFVAVFNQLKDKFAGSTQLTYSRSRPNWFVLTGESTTKKYYVRYHSNNDLVAGFFSIHDKSLPKEINGPLVSAITVMSLTMQTFAADLNASSVANLGSANLFEPVVLAVGDPAPDKDDQAISAPPPTPAPKTSSPATTTAPAKPPGDDAALRALQKKIAEMESNQRKLEQELAAKRAQKTDSSGSKVAMPSYEMMGLGAGLLFLLVLLLGRRSSASRTAAKPAEGGQLAAALPQQSVAVTPVVAAPIATAPVVAAAETPVVGPPPHLEQSAAAAIVPAPGRGGLAVIVAIGGMVAVVLIIAFLVEKIATVTRF